MSNDRGLNAEAQQSNAELHGYMAHPDFEYAATERTQAAPSPALEGGGWEVNPKEGAGVGSFVANPALAYWRRRRMPVGFWEQ